MDQGDLTKRLAALTYHAANGTPEREICEKIREILQLIEDKKSDKKSTKDLAPAIEELFAYWVQITNRGPATRLTTERRKALSGRLRSYSVEDVKRAIRGIMTSAHHRGENETNTRYLELTLICRNDTKLEEFMEMGGEDPTPKAERKELIRRRDAAQERGDHAEVQSINEDIRRAAGQAG